MFEYNKKLTSNAKTLRKHMTREENQLWFGFLKKLPIPVHRQKNLGNYIVDFYIAKNKIAIEIDGIQHSYPRQMEKDIKRDEDLKQLGITVLRYTNEQINLHFSFVEESILRNIGLTENDLISG